MRKYRTREHAGPRRSLGEVRSATAAAPCPAPPRIAVAAPIEGDVLTFMNNDWRIPRFGIAAELGLDRLTLLNDFGAVAHAVSVIGAGRARSRSAGPGDLPADGITTVIGPGTGLGVAILDRRGGARHA